ncbi:MAG: metallophosphoesterase [Candidatus Norongarragalinales archaeon]
MNLVKVLCVADFHGEEGALELLKRLIEKEKPALVLVAGDVTQFGPIDYANRVLESVKASEAECLAVHGNTDSMQVKLFFEKQGVSLHNKKIVWKGIEFVGYGGSAPTPFRTAITYSEAQIYADLSKLVTKNSVLVTHSPPFGLPFELDKTFDLKPVGSKAVRKIIEERRPKACVCAHVHEREGEANVLGCRVIKLAPLRDGRACVLDVNSLSPKFY